MDDAPAIRVEGLRHRYPSGGFELQIERLEVPAGGSVACVGPSGSGKTTLLHLCAGILAVQQGRVVVDGVDLGTLDDRARRRFRVTRIGLVFQEFELLEYLDVRDNVLLPYLVHPALSLDAAVERRLTDLAESVGIAGLLRRRPHELSQGERQRAALCRALVTEPRLLLADEPTGNLDPENGARTIDLLLHESRRRGAALVVVTHDHGVVDRFDAVVDLGRVADSGATR